LEASIRNCDISEDTTPAHVETVLDWEKLHKNDGSLEVPFKPARVIFQDFTYAAATTGRL
jgi:aconitase A